MLHMLHDFQAFTFISSYFNIFQLVNRIFVQRFLPSTPVAWWFRSVEATKNWWPKVAPTATFLLLRVRWAEVNNSNEDNDDNNDQEEELTKWSTVPPKKRYGRVFRESISSKNDIAFFLQEFVTFDVSPRSIRDAIGQRKTKDGVTNAVRSYDVLILEGATPEILITVFLYSVLLTLTYLKVLILLRAKTSYLLLMGPTDISVSRSSLKEVALNMLRYHNRTKLVMDTTYP